MIIGIDPGTFQSAYVEYENGKIRQAGIFLNQLIANELQVTSGCLIAIEHVRSYGNIIGQTTLETCVWIGRLQQAAQTAKHCPNTIRQIERKEVLKHICNNGKAKDSNVRAALIDRYGGTRQKAIGTKKSPGPLYGIAKDMWSALAIAITAEETDVDYRFEKEKV